MIRQIVFDCSDTLLRFSALEELTKVVGDAARAAEIKGKIHGTRTWNLYDKGLMTEERLREEILPLFDEADRPYAAWYIDNWLRCYAPVPGMEELLRELYGKGWPLYILSDFPPCFGVLQERFPAVFQYFKGVAVSYECQATKGDKGLFPYLEKTFGLKAEECIFVDDVPRLVENACSLGFRGIVFEHVGKLREQLEELGISLSERKPDRRLLDE